MCNFLNRLDLEKTFMKFYIEKKTFFLLLFASKICYYKTGLKTGLKTRIGSAEGGKRYQRLWFFVSLLLKSSYNKFDFVVAG